MSPSALADSVRYFLSLLVYELPPICAKNEENNESTSKAVKRRKNSVFMQQLIEIGEYREKNSSREVFSNRKLFALVPERAQPEGMAQ